MSSITSATIFWSCTQEKSVNMGNAVKLWILPIIRIPKRYFHLSLKQIQKFGELQSSSKDNYRTRAKDPKAVPSPADVTNRSAKYVSMFSHRW